MEFLSESFENYICDSDFDEENDTDIDIYSLMEEFETNLLNYFAESGASGRCQKSLNCKYREKCKYSHTQKEKEFFEKFKSPTCKHGKDCKYKIRCQFYHTPEELKVFRKIERDFVIKRQGILPFCENMRTKGECKEAGLKCVLIHSEKEMNEFFYKLNSKFQFDAACDFQTNSTTTKSCSVCFVDYKKADWVKILRCKHLFHLECIKQWFKTKRDCPICKANYEKELK